MNSGLQPAAAVPQSFFPMFHPTIQSGGNVFAELVNTVEVCSLGQITACLTNVVGKFRPMV